MDAKPAAVTGSNIPKARSLIEDVIADAVLEPWACKNLSDALDLMTRRSPKHRAARRSAPLTDDKAQEIKATRLRFPSWSLQQIAVSCQVNAGRVSEVLNG